MMHTFATNQKFWIQSSQGCHPAESFELNQINHFLLEKI